MNDLSTLIFLDDLGAPPGPFPFDIKNLSDDEVVRTLSVILATRQPHLALWALARLWTLGNLIRDPMLDSAIEQLAQDTLAKNAWTPVVDFIANLPVSQKIESLLSDHIDTLPIATASEEETRKLLSYTAPVLKNAVARRTQHLHLVESPRQAAALLRNPKLTADIRLKALEKLFVGPDAIRRSEAFDLTRSLEFSLSRVPWSRGETKWLLTMLPSRPKDLDELACPDPTLPQVPFDFYTYLSHSPHTPPIYRHRAAKQVLKEANQWTPILGQTSGNTNFLTLGLFFAQNEIPLKRLSPPTAYTALAMLAARPGMASQIPLWSKLALVKVIDASSKLVRNRKFNLLSMINPRQAASLEDPPVVCALARLLLREAPSQYVKLQLAEIPSVRKDPELLAILSRSRSPDVAYAILDDLDEKDYLAALKLLASRDVAALAEHLQTPPRFPLPPKTLAKIARALGTDGRYRNLILPLLAQQSAKAHSSSLKPTPSQHAVP